MQSRIFQLVAIVLMLCACAGPGERRDGLARHSSAHAHQDHGRAAAHYHDEPSPSEVYAGQVALLLSAQVFTCAFFVIIPDGSCHFYAGTGFYY